MPPKQGPFSYMQQNPFGWMGTQSSTNRPGLMQIGPGMWVPNPRMMQRPPQGQGQFTSAISQIGAANRGQLQANTQLASTLAGQNVATFNAQAAEAFNQALANALPGYKGLISQMTANAAAQLAGKLPPATQEMIKAYNAEVGIQGGLGSSGIAAAATARALGIGTLALQNQGAATAQSLFNIGTSIMPPMTNVAALASQYTNLLSSGMMTPAQAVQGSLGQQQISNQASQFQQNLAWQQQLSAMNQQFEQWAWNQQQQLALQAQFSGRQQQRQQQGNFEQFMGQLAGQQGAGNTATSSTIRRIGNYTPGSLRNRQFQAFGAPPAGSQRTMTAAQAKASRKPLVVPGLGTFAGVT